MTTFLRRRYRSYVGDNLGVMNEMTTLGTEVLADHVYREGEMEYDREALDEQVEWPFFKAVEFIRSGQRSSNASEIPVQPLPA